MYNTEVDYHTESYGKIHAGNMIACAHPKRVNSGAEWRTWLHSTESGASTRPNKSNGSETSESVQSSSAMWGIGNDYSKTRKRRWVDAIVKRFVPTLKSMAKWLNEKETKNALWPMMVKASNSQTNKRIRKLTIWKSNISDEIKPEFF